MLLGIRYVSLTLFISSRASNTNHFLNQSRGTAGSRGFERRHIRHKPRYALHKNHPGFLNTLRILDAKGHITTWYWYIHDRNEHISQHFDQFLLSMLLQIHSSTWSTYSIHCVWVIQNKPHFIWSVKEEMCTFPTTYIWILCVPARGTAPERAAWWQNKVLALTCLPWRLVDIHKLVLFFSACESHFNDNRRVMERNLFTHCQIKITVCSD